ncbi:RsmD family RNA methyltransferase [Polaribacter sp.]|nr:RsmD family RNA methyltransferase [Polaribacter sp.]MDC1375197.1 class I SAM-dependent methyltransferase [Polaribacter sp.]
MNLAILHSEVQEYISANLKTEITKLILKGSPFEKVSVQELANQIIAKQKSEKKLPTWFSTESIYYPTKISIEQTSSEVAAAHKVSLISGDSVIDITGGFGIDAHAFSKQFKKVVHCEINDQLSEIVAHNFKQLNIDNIETFAGDGLQFLKKTSQKFDCVFIDPSRRHDAKGKVFLLKDCLPYIPPKIEFLFTKATQILIKTSPILDISNTIKELKSVVKVQIIAFNNEVKELLFLLEKNPPNTIRVEAINYQKNSLQQIEFNHQSAAKSTYSPPLTYLYEPNAAILKSGGFHEISHQLKVFKLHQHSHLYTSDQLMNFPGRQFIITQSMPYDKKKIKKFIGQEKANITIRNFPKSVAQIRKETKIKEGGQVFIFFTTNLDNKQIVLFCRKV